MSRFVLLPATVFLLLAVACGGSGPGEATTAASAPSPAPTQSAARSPAELGDAVFAQAAEAIQALTKLVESHPPAAEARPRVAELKEAAIRRLVDLGRQYEALGPAERAQVDGKVTAAFSQAASTDWYRAYARVTTLYASEDAELTRQIQSFNIITQYAFFELLKKQDPAEAQRLGIK